MLRKDVKVLILGGSGKVGNKGVPRPGDEGDHIKIPILVFFHTRFPSAVTTIVCF